MLKVDIAIVSIATAFFIPGLIAWAANLKASVFVKSSVNVAASILVAAAAVLSSNPDGIPYKEFLIAVMVSLFTSQAMYDTVWKPTGLFRAIQNKFPGGIGQPVILDSEPGLNPDEALHHVRDLVKPIFTDGQWRTLREIIEQRRRKGEFPSRNVPPQITKDRESTGRPDS